jgi:hypothetical protein
MRDDPKERNSRSDTLNNIDCKGPAEEQLRGKEEEMEQAPRDIERVEKGRGGNAEEELYSQGTTIQEPVLVTHHADWDAAQEEEARPNEAAVQTTEKVRGGSTPTSTSDEDGTLTTPQASIKNKRRYVKQR